MYFWNLFDYYVSKISLNILGFGQNDAPNYHVIPHFSELVSNFLFWAPWFSFLITINSKITIKLMV